jgi:hypothetical protein
MQSYDKMETIHEACLQRADSVETDPGQCPERVTSVDWWIALAVAIVFGAMTFLGYLA